MYLSYLKLNIHSIDCGSYIPYFVRSKGSGVKLLIFCGEDSIGNETKQRTLKKEKRNLYNTNPFFHDLIHQSNFTMTTTEIFFYKFLVTKQVFFKSKYTYALVNLKPLVPGHVLVVPLRTNILRFADLSSEESIDYMNTLQLIHKFIQHIYKADALNIAIQDGPESDNLYHICIPILYQDTKQTDMEILFIQSWKWKIWKRNMKSFSLGKIHTEKHMKIK